VLVHVLEKLFKIGMNNRFSAKISLSQTLSRRKTVLKLLFDSLKIRNIIVQNLTEMESALNYKDCDIKYMFVRVPESCSKYLG